MVFHAPQRKLAMEWIGRPSGSGRHRNRKCDDVYAGTASDNGVGILARRCPSGLQVTTGAVGPILKPLGFALELMLIGMLAFMLKTSFAYGPEFIVNCKPALTVWLLKFAVSVAEFSEPTAPAESVGLVPPATT